jgi:hypothetical protein
VAVAAWQGACWEIRVKTGHDTVSSTTFKASSLAELEITMQRLIQELARQSAEVHLLDYEPFNPLPV